MAPDVQATLLDWFNKGALDKAVRYDGERAARELRSGTLSHSWDQLYVCSVSKTKSYFSTLLDRAIRAKRAQRAPPGGAAVLSHQSLEDANTPGDEVAEEAVWCEHTPQISEHDPKESAVIVDEEPEPHTDPQPRQHSHYLRDRALVHPISWS
jgi:hypothetical protein